MELIDVPVEKLTDRSFGPYGIVINAGRNEEEFALRSRMIDLGFSVDGLAKIYLIRYPKQDMEVSKFERHFNMTEARISLCEASIIVVVGDPTTDPVESLPDIRTVRAFVIHPTQGLIFKRATWHSLNCYPIRGEYADFAFITEKESEEELADVGEKNLKRTQILDYVVEQEKRLRLLLE